MPNHIKARLRRILLASFARADAKAFRFARPHCAFVVTIGDVDLPAFVSDGKLYIQAPLPTVFQAFAESLPEFIRDMEIGVSDAGGSTFSFDRDGHPVSLADVVESDLVRDMRDW